jgi:hypothetical protein
MALAPVFPLLPWFWPLLLLQVVNGGALQFAWSGSQGEAEYLGRFRQRGRMRGHRSQRR